MKRFGEPFKATMANGLKQEFRICEKCGLWVPNDKQVLLDHSESERRKGEGMNEIELKQDIIKRLLKYRILCENITTQNLRNLKTLYGDLFWGLKQCRVLNCRATG